MNKQEYKSYIINKYSIMPELLNVYIRVDAMMMLLKFTNWPKETYFKGAASLLFEHNYKRKSHLTQDLDFSITRSINDYINELKTIFPKETDIYNYSFIKQSQLKIATVQYSGFNFSILFSVKNLNIKNTINLDFAVEELQDIEKPISKINNHLKYYSMEQTIAEKFVSMIYHGHSNSREKDFEDLKDLYSLLNENSFYTIIKKFIIIKNISETKINAFKKNYREYEYIQKYELNSIISIILEKVFK